MAAVRDRLVLSLLLLLVLGSSLSLFLGSSAVIEKSQFAAVFTAGGLRIASVLGLILFVVFFVRRSFESKDVEFLLSRPVGRLQLLISYSVAFAFLGAVMGLAELLCVYSVAPQMFGQGHILWGVSIIAENIIMVITALFFSMYLSSAATSAMAVMGFYVLARMMGQLLGISDSNMVDDYGPVAMILQLVSVITPRLDLLGQTSWLVYGVSGDYGVGYAVLQGTVFCALVFMGALFDFIRRQF
ncbi:MAG: hypothetical protein KDI13_03330 [Alphaproteobacteria bacterium]|nr:hypothetical protein [Alphaproteobacteria bacterium]